MVPDVESPLAPGRERSSRPDRPTFTQLPALPPLPRRLAAEVAGWVREVDVVIVGSGIAGLTAALECSDLGSVMVVTKDVVAAGSTHWAQGGIASVQAAGDTVQQHIDDTLVAGAGLCIEKAVRVLVTEGPEEVAKLISRGAQFDRDAAGELELTREGGHHVLSDHHDATQVAALQRRGQPCDPRADDHDIHFAHPTRHLGCQPSRHDR